MLPGSKKWGEEKLRNSPASKYQGERRRGGASGAGAEIAHGQDHEGADFHTTALGGPYDEASEFFPEETVACGDPTLE